MSELWGVLRDYWRARSARERWFVVLAVCGLSLFVAYSAVIAPLEARAATAAQRATELEASVSRALRIASEVRLLQGELRRVEAQIQPGAQTNLLSLLERLAAESQIDKTQLESIKPKRPSNNPRYPETRVEVSLRGTTLSQTVNYLTRIETAPLLLIVRSLKVTARGGDESRVDVVFSVSTFERA